MGCRSQLGCLQWRSRMSTIPGGQCLPQNLGVGVFFSPPARPRGGNAYKNTSYSMTLLLYGIPYFQQNPRSSGDVPYRL